MQSELRKRIRKARVSAGLSQKQLAGELGISEKTISAYEKGRAIPPVPTLEKISNITVKPIQYFVKNGNKDILGEISGKLDIIIEELKKVNNK